MGIEDLKPYSTGAGQTLTLRVDILVVCYFDAWPTGSGMQDRTHGQ
jgi:hypothetical protein